MSHGNEAGNPQSDFVFMMIDKNDNWVKFYEANKGLDENSGHILDSTKVAHYENQNLNTVWIFLIVDPYLGHNQAEDNFDF